MPSLVMGWILKQVLPKVADKTLAWLTAAGRMDTLVQELDTSVSEWAADVKKEFPSFVENPLFPLREAPPADPDAVELWKRLEDGKVPEAAAWGRVVRRRWKSVGEELGTDAEAFYLLPAEKAAPYLDKLAVALHQACARNAPLFQTSTVAFHEWLKEQVGGVRADLAALLPLDAHLRSLLQQTADRVSKLGRTVYTPDLLFGLLVSPDGQAKKCFVTVAPEATESLIERFGAYAPGPSEAVPFTPIEWDEHEDVRNAGRLAAASDVKAVTHKFLLLAILGGDSATARGLRGFLGADQYDALVSEVRGTQDVWMKRIPSPGAYDLYKNLPGKAGGRTGEEQ